MTKAAIYCRVSTDKEDQANSFEAQQRYFREYINRRDDLELYYIYADNGTTGTSTKNRTQFNRMISDAYRGKFSLIITKEVSRFSRNILDTISYTRELKSMGIGVIFMNDGINTLEADAELRLSIMSSIAQEESRKTSARVKWGQTRQMERGVVFGRSMLGYDVENGKMTVNKEGAELVRLIFYKYGIEKKGTSIIAEELREAGFKTFSGSEKWSRSHIVKILKNEKYVGDLVQKKTYTPDYLTHEKKYNRGAEELVVIKNHHESIIEHELWNTVQDELSRRNRHNNEENPTSIRYPLSGKIKCGECGANFISRKKKRSDGTFYRKWRCSRAANEGRYRTDSHGNTLGCNIGRMLRDDIAVEMIQTELDSLEFDRESIIQNVTETALEAIGNRENSDDTEYLLKEITRAEKKKEDALDAFFDGDITKEEMQSLKERYNEQINSLREKLESARNRDRSAEYTDLREKIHTELSDILHGKNASDTIIRNLVEQITVYSNRISVKLQYLPQIWWFDG